MNEWEGFGDLWGHWHLAVEEGLGGYGWSCPFCAVSRGRLLPMILRLYSPDQKPSALEPILRLWLDYCPPDLHFSQGNSQLQSWVPGRLTALFQVYGVYSLTASYPFKRGNENGAFQVCICSFMKCHPENWSNPASTLLLLHFQMTSSSLEWNSGLVIIASRGSDVLSFCLFFFFTSWHFNKSNHTWTNWLVPLVLQTSNSQFLVHHKIWAEDLYSAFSSHVRKHKDSLISSSSSCVL